MSDKGATLVSEGVHALPALPVSNQLAVHGIDGSFSQLLGLERNKPIPFAPAHIHAKRACHSHHYRSAAFVRLSVLAGKSKVGSGCKK